MQIAWRVTFQRGGKNFFKKKKKKGRRRKGEILKLYLIEFHTTKTLTKFWGCANAKDTLNFRSEAHYPPRASYKPSRKKSDDDATTSYFKFQLHHCIPISSMYVCTLRSCAAVLGLSSEAMSIHAKSSSSSPPPLIVNNLSSPKM